MTAISIVFPHQLFEDNPCLTKTRPVWLIEDELYFGQYAFHQQKLLLHRASMHYYKDFLTKKGYQVSYLTYPTYKNLAQVFEKIQKETISQVHYVDTTDYLLERRLKRLTAHYSMTVVSYESPLFLTEKATLDNILTKNKGGSYLMANFYTQQRKRLDILLDADGSPKGGKWSFDEDNRKSLPASQRVPKFINFVENEFVKRAKQRIQQDFGDNYGKLDTFNYPTTHQEAMQLLEHFLEKRFHLFGDYEDAISSKERIIFHSVLTPALNIGLITPKQILEKSLDYAQNNNIPLNSLEGFVRQLIGWREFVRGIYEKEGVFERTHNFFGFDKTLPKSFYEGTTGIEPLDFTIHRVLNTAYCHHIERLMILGNFMLLCQFSPTSIYQWFMELFIDAYDWVMVPNVYGMTQYADGGLITTKPYISGSNYILKMSNYKKGKWADTWNALYWNFIHQHREVFENNHRMRMMTTMLDKMKKETLHTHLTHAETFLGKLV